MTENDSIVKREGTILQLLKIAKQSEESATQGEIDNIMNRSVL